MPASTLDPVNAALRTSLTKTTSTDSNLDQQLSGSTKKALLANIEFESAGTCQSVILDKLKSKYITLKANDTPQARFHIMRLKYKRPFFKNIICKIFFLANLKLWELMSNCR